MKAHSGPLFRAFIVFGLLVITVPWGAGRWMASNLGPLPGWVWYALGLNVIFAIAICTLYEKWWDDQEFLHPDEYGGVRDSGSGDAHQEKPKQPGTSSGKDVRSS